MQMLVLEVTSQEGIPVFVLLKANSYKGKMKMTGVLYYS